ncbi:zona pellucida sperm-binding protein 3 [Eucyclogobius newberryi]|uniref:zona pellucida sperm-binding protein 3 n=1 Tax=Eucyclogobius newberryi TaxID=166745 RepID=UPI003B5AEC1F
MSFCLARILVIGCALASCKGQEFNKNAEIEWDNMSKLTRKGSSEPLPKAFKSHVLPDFRMLPDFVVASSAIDQKDHFKPETGVRPLPNSVMPLLFPTSTVPPTESTQPKVLEMLCHIDRIYVRIRRDVFKTSDAYKYLKLGSCAVNQATPTHYYFLYLLTSDCDFIKESNVDHLTIKNVVHYLPTTPVVRDLLFDVPVQCNYQRLLHSYKVGLRPKLLRGTLFKSLRRKRPILLVPQDELGNVMTRPYVMGEGVFFAAKLADGTPAAADERIYINKCFITSSIVPSSPKYTIIDNYGCMVDGKKSVESKFLTGSSKMIQKFTINAFILTELASTSGTKQLYMHCDVSVGAQPPNDGLKACNYNQGTQMWDELYGDDTVCSCCDSTCSPLLRSRAKSKMVTSQPWKVDFEDDLTIKPLDANFGFKEDITTEKGWDDY